MDGELVSWMQTFTVGHRLRGVTLESAGVVGVHTDDAHQRRGHMRFMLETVIERAEARGAPLSTLYGVPDLYHRWAYATVMPEFTFTIATRLAEAVPASHQMRVGEAVDLPAVARLYNRETARFSGMRVREPERWLGPRQGLWFGRLDAWVQVAIDADGGMVGYCIGDQVDHDAQQLDIVDAQATDTAAAASIVRAMADEAVRRRMGKIAFHVHPESRVGVYLRNLEATFSSLRPIGRSQMVRISLPGPVLEALQPYVRNRRLNWAVNVRHGSSSNPNWDQASYDSAATCPHARCGCRRLACPSFCSDTGPRTSCATSTECSSRVATPNSWMSFSRPSTPTAIGRTGTDLEAVNPRRRLSAQPRLRTRHSQPAASAPVGREQRP